MRSLLVVGPLLVVVVGCATAVPPGLVGDDDVPATDASAVDARDIDARIIDAPAFQTITLSQTASNVVTAQASVACTDTATGVVRENSYYRVFRLADFGITRPFTVNMVSFAVELAGAGGGLPSQNMQVKLYSLTGALQLASLTPIAGNNVVVPNGELATVNVPITPAPLLQSNQTLVAELFIPDGMALANVLFVGANNGSETATGYLRAPLCGIMEPVTFASISFPQVKLILTVTGTY